MSARHSHRGDGNFSGADSTYSILGCKLCSCASESRGKRVSKFAIRVMGKIQLWHVLAIVDRSVGRSCSSVSRGKRVSNFPIGALGTFEDERSAHRANCVPTDGARGDGHCASPNIDATALQATTKT
jgi:hypothetical protein